MKNTAPMSSGILAVAGLFGFIGGAVSFVMYDWRFLGALFLAIVIAIIVAIILMLGWREPASPPVQAGTAGVGAGTAPSAGAASQANDADRDAGTVEAETATAAAVSRTTAASADDAAKVKSSTTLPGEDELADRKGDWKYEAEAKPKAKPAKKAKPAPVAGAKDAAAKKAAAPADKSVVAAPDGPGEKPEMLTAAREGGADDLKQIKGVGPKMENMLNEMGVYHFDQVASWSGDEVSWVDQNLKGFKGRVSRDNWVDQAKTLAAGGETAFSKKVEKGGVY
jgi:predicted flap endonuclease-1-like 5' DNA nuclease